MNKGEKMWYSLKEAAEYLYVEESLLQRKVMGLNFETRTLPGEKGEFLSRKDVLDIERMIRGPRLTT
jgi:hypothetical protein